jgi:hypothetical protein
MAASVAAELKADGVEVETVKGGFGEFSVAVDGNKVVDTNRLWYPSRSKVVSKVRATLKEQKA